MPDLDPSDDTDLILREPAATEGHAVHQLIARCKPLDENSVYCNLLQCSHFAATSCAAVMDGDVVGFVSGYRVPPRPTTLFVWQVAVDERARGRGLAKRLISAILQRDGNRDIDHLETTITPDNAASWALFEGLARQWGADGERHTLFEREAHFAGAHDSEVLYRIGPFATPA